MLHEVLARTEISASFAHEEAQASSTPRFAGVYRVLLLVVLSGSVAGMPMPASSSDASSPAVIREIMVHKSFVTLEEICSPQPGWIDSDAVAVSQETLALAKVIIGNMPAQLRLPHIAPSADGEVGFTWVNGKDKLEAMLQPDHHLVWITKISGEFSLGKDITLSTVEDLGVFYWALGRFYELS